MGKRLLAEVVSGRGEGSYFLNLNWVQESFKRLLGFKPYAGTLNLLVSHSDKKCLLNLAKQQGIEMEPPKGTPFCKALLLKASLGGYRGALVFPEESVWKYRDLNIVEFVAPVELRKELGLSDGHKCYIEVLNET